MEIPTKEVSDGLNKPSIILSSEKTKIDDAVKRLIDLSQLGDTEIAHIEADEILLEFVPKEVAEAFREVHKWYA